MIRRALPFAALALIAAPVLAADCPSELKPTDDYKTLSEKIKCLNDRINEMEKRFGSADHPGAAPAAGPPPAAKPGPETAWNDFRVAGRSCRDAGKGMVCKVTFTAPKNVSLAIFLDDTSLFDQDGARTTLSEVNFGRKLNPIGHLRRNYVRLDLPKGVGSTAEFEFKNGASPVQAVSAISFAIHDLSVEDSDYRDWEVDSVTIKDIPIVR